MVISCERVQLHPEYEDHVGLVVEADVLGTSALLAEDVYVSRVDGAIVED